MLSNQLVNFVPTEESSMLAAKPADFAWRRGYGWYGSNGIGDGNFDANRAAKGYDWYWNGPPAYVPHYADWVAKQ